MNVREQADLKQSFREEAVLFFASLPPEETREYEKQIARFSSECTRKMQTETLKEIIEEETDVSYEAFFCLCTVYRRNKDFDLLRKLLFRYKDRFGDRISYNHLVIQYHVHSEALFDYDSLLEMAYADAKRLSDNAGFLQTFCNAFATICEQCNDEDAQGIVDRWYATALEFINKAIELDPKYAKFYWTKARIIAFGDEFAEANRLLAQAISLEDSSRPDYAITIVNYQTSRTRFAVMQQKQYFMTKIAQIEKQLAILNQRFLVDDGVASEQQMPFPDVYDGQCPYVFVSYAHKDRTEIYKIISALQTVGVRIWYDKGLRAGDEWPEEIAQRLDRSSVVIVMLSSNAVGSKFVRKEINYADNADKKIIPVLIDDCQLSPGISLQLGFSQRIHKGDDDFIHKLGKECGKNAGYVS